MGTYLVTAPNGRKLKLTGDAPPTEQDLDEIFSSYKSEDKSSIMPNANGIGAMEGAKNFAYGMGRALNPMNAVRAIGTVAGDQLEALANLDPRGLIPLAPTASKMTDQSLSRLGEGVRLAVDERDPLAAAGQLGAAVPLVGEAAADLGERTAQTGDWAGAAGEVAGTLVAPKLYGAATGRIIKPLTKVGGKVLEGGGRIAKNTVTGYLDSHVGLAKSLGREIRREIKGQVKEAVKPKPPASDPSTVQKGLEEYRARIAAEEAKRRSAKVIRPDPEPPKTAREATADVPKPKTSAEKLEAAKSKLKQSDVIEAKPAFPGQQGAKGATKARFRMQAERAAKGWLDKGKSKEFVSERLKETWRMTDDEIAEILK